MSLCVCGNVTPKQMDAVLLQADVIDIDPRYDL